MKSNPVLLLTACINPNRMVFTQLTDVDERRAQYIASLQFYLANTDTKIVFVENSGCDLSPLFMDDIKKGRLEILSFNGNEYDRTIGKGYGEALIIQYALEHSIFISNNSRVIKVTGRLQCKNIKEILERCNNEDKLYAILGKNKWGLECDSRIFVSSVCFLNAFFLPKISQLNDSNHYYFEHLLYDASREWMKSGHDFCEIWFFPEIAGSSGSYGFQYDTSFKSKLSFYLHYLLHRIGYFGSLCFWK